MKSLNVKKLAALAVGATMVLGTAAAAVANNLPTDRSWYLDSKIVVGSNAAASDVVSAAEISAAIAQLAYKKAEIQ
ncbi:MAG: S-layer protein, partial [Candidatus Diapherotrites archaeon]|nr:S-layer protein [Candidatus Diapherotrites archaeon]